MKRVTLTPLGLDISKPGFDVDVATEAQKHISSSIKPALVLQAGRVTVTTATPVLIPWPYTLNEIPCVEVQIGNTSTLTLLPWWNRTGTILRITIDVTVTGVTFTALAATMYVNYIAVAEGLS